MNSKKYNVPVIGDITITKHYKAKRIILKIKPDNQVLVTIPKLMPFKIGMQFAIEKSAWILEHQKKFESKTPTNKLYTTESVFKIRHIEIRIQQFKGSQISTHFKNNCYYLLFPLNETIESNKNQLIIKNYIIERIRFEAKKHLPLRTKELCEKYGFKINNVYFKNLKSRWGSCSGINNINLNIHLMRLPENLSDFIILHELCHTVHKNHGKAFHQLLNQLVGDEKQLNRELKKYTIHL